MFSSWIAISLAARAAPPDVQVDGGLLGAVASGPDAQASLIGAQLGVARPLGRWALGGRLLGGALAPTAFADAPVLFAVEPTARWWLSDPERPALSLVVGAGLSVESRVQGILSAGAGLDLARRGSLRPRLEGSYHLQPGPGRWRLSLSVGLAWQRPPPAPVEPEPEPEPVPPPPQGLVWVPEPVCDWVVYDEAAGLAPLAVWDDGGPRPIGEARSETPPPPPSLVVAAWPGDEVRLDGEVLPTDAWGIAVAHPPEGPVIVQVRGGGRGLAYDLAVADEHALWVSVRPPEPVRVTFPVDVATLDPDALMVVERVIANRGDWALEVRGSHSLEGDPERNRVLARARAEAVLEALRTGGVPDERLRLSDALDVAGSEDPPELLRAAVIYPVVEEPP